MSATRTVVVLMTELLVRIYFIAKNLSYLIKARIRICLQIQCQLLDLDRYYPRNR